MPDPRTSYPSDNCAVVWPDPNNPPRDPIAMLPTYLTHEAGKSFAQPYLNSTMLAQQWGKPFLLFETNTASCGGFPGISDAFASALWGIDHALQLAYSNFTGVLYHFGGQNVSYNVSTSARLRPCCAGTTVMAEMRTSALTTAAPNSRSRRCPRTSPRSATGPWGRSSTARCSSRR